MVTLREIRSWHRPLVDTALLCVVLLLVSAVGLALDQRLINGEAAWAKPAKFALSITVYNLTLAWLLHLSHRWRRLGWWMGTAVAVATAAEMALIITQVVRGRMSHFNSETVFDAAVYSAMGTMIGGLWVATFVIAVLLMFQRLRDRSTTWAIRIGVWIALAGMAVGPLMTAPTPAQREELVDGGGVDVLGAHTVGLPDGGPGLPFVGWSTVAGDLRVGHFVGIHGLQAMILLAFLLVLLASRVPRLSDERARTRVVAVLGAAYALLTALTVWQALRGQSVVAPDALTLAALVALGMATALGLVWALHVSSRQSDEEEACGSSSTYTTSSTRAGASTRP
ncbi:hypothetical protein IDM40_23970 [Nocardiopsis sp. HNM0947]|uniref:Integral membrane protein n=1 Tax=Nocardiopsis coralli TaxID=2772213 RepID=A0ABR9PDC2_9ACTN|nr:hypothetical protein [Nocardiopsis coralli]MBE3001730.1 hypothetical protein [Nocardiopsis coralli]